MVTVEENLRLAGGRASVELSSLPNEATSVDAVLEDGS